MELVLPESIVQMSVGAEYVLFRAGSGHAWIAGGDDGRRAGKLRRLTTINRLVSFHFLIFTNFTISAA